MLALIVIDGREIKLRSELIPRYALSLEGNDVATNLKWLLASNSVVVMPSPTMEVRAKPATCTRIS